jgi:hypothetical protein
MIFEEAAHVYVIRLAGSWNRFNFFWATFLSKRRSDILGCKQRFKNAVNDAIGIEPVDS